MSKNSPWLSSWGYVTPVVIPRPTTKTPVEEKNIFKKSVHVVSSIPIELVDEEKETPQPPVIKRPLSPPVLEEEEKREPEKLEELAPEVAEKREIPKRKSTRLKRK
jgi:hypothetical protein